MPAKARPYAKAETVVDEYFEDHPSSFNKKSANARKQQSLPSDSGYSSTGLTSSASNTSHQLPLRTRVPSSVCANVGSESEMPLQRSATAAPTTGPYQPPPGKGRRAAQPPHIQTNPPLYNNAQPHTSSPYYPPQFPPGPPPPSASLPSAVHPPSSFPQRMAVPHTGAFSQPPPPQRRRSQSAARPVSYAGPPDGYPFSPLAHNSPSPHAVPSPAPHRATVRIPTNDGGYWERDYDPAIDEPQPVGSRPLKRGNSKRENRRASVHYGPVDYFGAQPQTVEQIQGQYSPTQFYTDGDLMPPPPPPRPSSARPQPRQTIPIHYGPGAQVPAPNPSRKARPVSYQTTDGAPVREYASSSQPRLRSDGDMSTSRSRKAEAMTRRAEEHMESNGDRTAQSYMDELLQQNHALARRQSQSHRSRAGSYVDQSVTESELARRVTRISFDGGEFTLEPGRNVNFSSGEDGSQSVIISAPNGSRGSQSYRTDSNARSTRAASFADRSVQASGSSRTRKAPVLPKKDSNGS